MTMNIATVKWFTMYMHIKTKYIHVFLLTIPIRGHIYNTVYMYSILDLDYKNL